MEELEERDGRLLARVYAQELQDIGISAADTVYIKVTYRNGTKKEKSCPK